MKKTLLTAIASTVLLFSTNANAACETSNEVSYIMKHGHAIRTTASVTSCGNISGGSTTAKFKDGVTLSVGTELDDNGNVARSWATLNGHNATRVQPPAGVPSAFSCFAISAENAYCTEVY